MLCHNGEIEVILTYANNTLSLAESQEQLQVDLNSIYLSCQTWKHEANPTKTEVVVFTKRKMINKLAFTNNGENIAVDDFVYLGVTFIL